MCCFPERETGGISFYYQKSYVDKNNIDLSDKAIDDRHLND